MVSIGTPLSDSAVKVMLCGSGELGKEVVIELQRLGVEVIALDSRDNSPAMQVAHRSYTFSMLDGVDCGKLSKKNVRITLFRKSKPLRPGPWLNSKRKDSM